MTIKTNFPGAREGTPSESDYDEEDGRRLAGVCPVGHECPEKTMLPVECPPGTLANTEGVSTFFLPLFRRRTDKNYPMTCISLLRCSNIYITNF